MAQQANIIRAERQRKLQQLSFAPSQILSRDLPRDTVLKRLVLRLSGAVQTTYASGSPVADQLSTFDSLIPRVDVIVNGNRTVKSVKPFIMAQMQMLASTVLGERKSSAAAAALNPPNPTVDAGFTFGTTTQYTTVAETIEIAFEDRLAMVGSESTYLNLKGVASAELKLTCASFSSVQRVDDTSPVVYGNSTLAVDIVTKEAQDIDPFTAFADLKETTKAVQFSAQVTESVVELNRGNFLRGIFFMVRDGSSTKPLANNAVTDIKLVLNGQNVIKATTFQALQAENRAYFGMNAPFGSNVSRYDGCAYLDLLRNGIMATALDVRPVAGVDNVQLLLSTAASGAGATYSSFPVEVTIMTQEIVPPLS